MTAAKSGPQSGGLRWLLLGLAVVGLVGYLIYSATGTSAEYYQTVGELRAHPVDKDARVLGTVQNDIVRTDGGLHIRFTAAEGPDSMRVDYTGTVPDIFRPGVKVVVEGRLGRDGVFHARTLQAKCPSRFSSSTPAQ